MEDELPRRRFELHIKIGGDEWKDVVHELRFLLPHIEEHGKECNSVSGGCSSSHTVNLREDKAQTAGQYSRQLEAWVAKDRLTRALDGDGK